MAKQRVIFYVDGFNLYYGLKEKKWKKYYWLDMVKFFGTFIRPHQELVAVHYFSAIPKDKGKHDRQDLLFQANKINPFFYLHLGKYLAKQKKCWKCNAIHNSYEEKETDVRIAVQMIRDVVQNNCDISIIVSADSDLIPPIEFIKEYTPQHKIIAYFPPNKFSYNLKGIANAHVLLDNYKKQFENCMLDESIKHPVNGFMLNRPSNWT